MEDKMVELSLQVGNLLNEIRSLKEDVADAREVLYFGKHGNNSILVRLSALEQSIKDVLGRVEDIEEIEINIKSEDRKARWNFFLLLILSVIGWVTAIITWLTENQFMKWIIDTVS